MYIERFIFKKAFTLAEIMIALVVIGIITSILLPVAFNNVPNENVMKFKKADATLTKVFSELVSSGEYFTTGDLSKKANGTTSNDEEYFCKSFSDMVSTKNVECATAKTNIAYYNNTKNTFIEKYIISQAIATEYDICLYADSTNNGFGHCYTTKCREAMNTKEKVNGIINGNKALIFKNSDGTVNGNYKDGSITIGYSQVISCPCSSSINWTYTSPSLYACKTKNITVGYYTNNGTLVATQNVVYPETSQSAAIIKQQSRDQVLAAYEKEQENGSNSSSNSSGV